MGCWFVWFLGELLEEFFPSGYSFDDKTYKGTATTKILHQELQTYKHDNVERERRNLKGNAVPQLEKANLQILREKMLKRALNFVWP